MATKKQLEALAKGREVLKQKQAKNKKVVRQALTEAKKKVKKNTSKIFSKARKKAVKETNKVIATTKKRLQKKGLAGGAKYYVTDFLKPKELWSLMNEFLNERVWSDFAYEQIETQKFRKFCEETLKKEIKNKTLTNKEIEDYIRLRGWK